MNIYSDAGTIQASKNHVRLGVLKLD